MHGSYGQTSGQIGVNELFLEIILRNTVDNFMFDMSLNIPQLTIDASVFLYDQ